MSGSGSQCIDNGVVYDPALIWTKTCRPGDGECPSNCEDLDPPSHGNFGTCSNNGSLWNLDNGDTCSLGCQSGYIIDNSISCNLQ